MRLTALCVCGTLLAFSSLFWITADSDEGVLLVDKGFGPCTVTLMPQGPCRQVQDESMCPYLLTLPPLTVHLPQQLRELEKIVEDLQKLKDSVDELREMCADCTVSQTERACGRQRERERETLSEGTDRREDEPNWVNGFKQECSTGGVKMEGDGDSKKRVTLEEKERKKGETERESNEGVVKENEEGETQKEVLETGGKTQTDRAKGKDKVGHTKVTTGGGNDRIVAKKVTDKNNGEAERDTAGKGNAKGYQENKLEHGKERTSSINVKNKEKTEESGHHVWQDKTKETETQTKASDRIKMSEDHDENTNQEQEQNREERKKEMERRVKVEKNNEELKETERTGRTKKEETIKEGVEDRETGKEIKTEDEDMESGEGDSDGESPSSKATKRTDFVSISPTPHSTISIASRLESADLNEAVSSLPSPPLPSSTLHYITDVRHEITTQNTGLRAAGISKPPNLDAGSETATPMSTVSGQNIISLTTASRLTPRTGLQGHISSTTTTTTTTAHHQDLTAFPEATDDSHWTAKNNVSSNTKTGMKPLPGQGPKQGDKLKPKLKPEANPKLKNPRTYRKPDRAPLPDIKTKYDQKQQPSHQKPTTNQRPKPKPGQDPEQVETSKPKQRTPPEIIPTDQNLKNHSGQDHTPEQNKSPIQKPKSQEKTATPFQRPALHQRPRDANTTRSDEYPVIDQEHESDQVPGTNQTSKATKMQKPDKQPKSEEKTKPNPRQVPESKQSQAASFTEKPDQKEKFNEGPSQASNSNQDSTPGKKLIPSLLNITPNQKPKTSQNIPGKPKPVTKPNQKHPKPGINFKPKPNVKPNSGHKPPQTNWNLKRPNPGQTPNLNAKGAPQAESNRTPTPRPPSFYGLPTKSTVRPGATPIQRPKPAVQPKPRPKTKTDPSQISQTISDHIQTSQTNTPLTSGPVKHTAEVTHSPGDTEFNPSVKKTVTTHPKTSNSLENGAFPHLHTLPEDSTVNPNSRIVSDLRPQTANQPPLLPVTTRPNKIIHGILPSVIPSTIPGSTQSNIIPKSDSGTQAKKHHNMEKMAPAFSTTPSPIYHSISTPSPDFRSATATAPGTELPKLPADLPDLPKTPPNQKPKTSQNIPGKPKPVPKPNQKLPKPGINVKPKPNVKPNTGHKPPQTNWNLKRPNPGQTPNLNAKGAPRAESNRTPKPRPPSFYGLPTKSTVRPGATPVKRPKPAVQPKKSPKTETDPSQISQTISDHIQTSQSNMPLTSGPVKHTAEVTHSPGDTEFNPSMKKTVTTHPKTSNSLENGAFPHLHTLPEDSTVSPNSRIVSDLRPQTARQPPLLPVTTRPNKIIHGILPSVIPSTNPGSTQSNIIPKSDSGTQAKKHHNMEKMAPAFSTTPSPISHSISTPSSDFRSTTVTAPRPELPKLPADLPDLLKTPPNQKPKTSQNIPGKPKPVPKPNQKLPKPGTDFKPKPNVKPNSGHKPPQTNWNLKRLKPGQTPNLNAKGAPRAESNRTSTPRPPSLYESPTMSTVRPGATPVKRPKPAVQPKKSPKTEKDPSKISQTISDHIQTSQTNTPLTSGPVKHTAEVTHSPGDTEFNPSMKKTVTKHPKTSNSLENGAFPHLHTLPEDSTVSPNSRIVSDLRPQTASQPPLLPVTTRPNKIIHGILPSVIPSTNPGSTQSNIIPKSDSGTQAKKHHNMEKMAPAFSTTPSPISHSISTPSPDFRSTTVTAPRPELPKLPADLPDLLKTPPNQKPKTSQNIPGKRKPVSKPNQKLPKPGTDFKPKPNVKPNSGHKPPQTNWNLKRLKPGQTPNLNAKGAPRAESNRTSTPRPPSLYESPTKSTVRPGATAVKRPKPAMQPKPRPKTKTDPSKISWTVSDHIQTSQTNTPLTSGPVKHTAEVTHSPGDTEFNPSVKKTVTTHPKTSNSLENEAFPHLHTLPEDSTMSPNSRIVSDLRPQTASEPPLLPMTTRPNKIIHGILPSVIPSTSPGSTQSNIIPKSDSDTQAKKHHNMEKMAPSLISHSISTPSPDFRSTTATTPGTELPKLPAEASTPSARELRVKINQVAAFFNNSLSTNGRPPNMHHKEHSEENQGGSRPDGTNGKLPTVKPPKATVNMPPRDCSDHLLRGKTESGRYLVTPDPRTKSFPVYCDMQQEGGGWTVLQRRQDGSVRFNRTWAEYQSGFGELNGGEFWLGNNMIHLLTRDREMVLRVELEDFDRMTGYAQYEQFRVASERLRYKLTVGGYSGTAGDALRFSKRYDHNNRAFTTPDRDHDRYPSGNCGAYYSSGWWFDACMSSNLNGRYYVGRYKGVRDGIFWGTWHNILSEYYPTNERQSFKRARMMIRPKGFSP